MQDEPAQNPAPDVQSSVDLGIPASIPEDYISDLTARLETYRRLAATTLLSEIESMESELLDPRFEVVEAGRGGRYTYHGPGQRVTYTLLDLRRRGKDVRRFVHSLEDWVVATLGGLGVECWTVPERVGIWTKGPDGREAKIGAIGVRVRRWVTMHGFAVNLDPDLSHFTGIVPCGIDEFGVTSLADLGIALAPQAWDEALKAHASAFLAALEQQDAS